MLATYGSLLAILAAAALTGQAVFAICGRRRWSWLAPAVGLAALLPLAWGALRLPGDATMAAAAVIVVSLASAVYLWGRVEDLRDVARVGVPVALAAAAAASLPFVVEGRFGILGTGLNPDMSAHLFAADRLADGLSERLVTSGYPLGPHSLVVAVSQLGPGLVQAFDGLMLATALAAALAPLALLESETPPRAAAAALLVGFAYMVSSYLVQGAFKETLEALILLAFAVGLQQLRHGELSGAGWDRRAGLAAVPLGVLAAGSVYAYSFPGLLWLAGAAGLWALAELALTARRSGSGAAAEAVWRSAPAGGVALGVFAVVVAPEVPRMIDFASFETFDPSGAGLGNLFNPISPLEALGVWPSGDFRLDPGDGAVPAAGYGLGAALGAAALAYGLIWWLRRRELAVPAALAVAALLIGYAHVAGTPYQEAKAIALAAPLAMLVSVRALFSREPLIPVNGVSGAVARRMGGARGAIARRAGPAHAILAVAFGLAAAGCALLALANGPVGPPSYSPALTELRPLPGSTLVLAPQSLLDEHGRDYLVWELRGGRVCVEAAGEPGGRLPAGISQVVVVDGSGEPPFAGLERSGESDGVALWVRADGAPAGHGGCDVISTSQRAEPGG